MATKLYPPLIEGTIPAFYGTENLSVPFSLNRAVAAGDIAGFAMKLKTVQGSNLIATKTVEANQTSKYFINKVVQFSTSDFVEKLQIGQYYKLQLAFISMSTSGAKTVGYYSTVGVVKYTAEPTFAIDDLVDDEYNTHKYEYVLSYSQQGTNKDSSEKLYSTRFKLYDHIGNVIKDSGDIIHNTNKDTESYQSSERYLISEDLTYGEVYYLKATITTSNGLVLSTPKYSLVQGSLVSSSLKGSLIAENDFDDGYMLISLRGDVDENGKEYQCVGNFSLSRAASNDNYTWREICKFQIADSTTSRELWKDFTIEQGITYRYSIQEYNSKVYSDRIISEDTMADFEDSFLYDGTCQLKIRYNPKVSSFKTDIQEAKSETIGSKYPFIFRNGNVYYREFPISGLISYKMDDNEYFLTKDSIGLVSINNQFNRSNTGSEQGISTSTKTETFDLVGYNIYSERIFKMTVLDWLNNGKVKMFKSPGEGNYIVRLMNNSLSPNDAVGRMLHTFSSTAYEVAEYNFDNLNDYGFIDTSELTSITMKWATVELASHSEKLDTLLKSIPTYLEAEVPIVMNQELYTRICNANPSLKQYFTSYGSGSYALSSAIGNDVVAALNKIIGTITYVTDQINTYPACHIDVKDMMPGQLISYVDSNGNTQTIQIGVTGAYQATFEDPVSNVSVIASTDANGNLITSGLQGSITYGYESDTANTFGLITAFTTKDVPCRQWIGEPSTTLYTITDETITSRISHNLIDAIKDCRTSISKIISMKFYARPLREIFIKDKNSNGAQLTNVNIVNNGAYWDMDCTEKVDFNNLDPYYVYAVCHARFDYTYKSVPYEGYYIYANYNHGYYIDKNGEQSDVFAGYYLDGRSTSINMILYPGEEYHNTVTINEDTIDLAEIERYSLTDFDTDITGIYFDNGIIAEICYQTAITTYSIEDTNDSVKAAKSKYNAYIDKLDYFRKYIQNQNNLSDADIQFYSYYLNANIPMSESTACEYEENLIEEIKSLYERYVYLLQVALYSYEKEIES